MRVLAWSAGVLALWMIAFVVALLAIPARETEPDWSAAGGTPPPRDFLYLMYPTGVPSTPGAPSTSAPVPLFDRPDGAAVAVLARGVAVSEEELASGGWISVLHDPTPLWVRRADLAFEPPRGDTGQLVRAYFDAFKARNPGVDGLRVSVTQTTAAGVPGTTVFERHTDDDHFQRYAYRVIEGVAHPEAMWALFGPAWAIEASSPGLAALAATGVTAGGVWLTCRVRSRSRGQRRPMIATP